MKATCSADTYAACVLRHCASCPGLHQLLRVRQTGNSSLGPVQLWWLCSSRKACACLTLHNLLCAEGSNCGKEVCGAWMVMVEVSVQDPAAPSWEFLQVCCPHPQTTDSVRLQLYYCLCLFVMLMAMIWGRHQLDSLLRCAPSLQRHGHLDRSVYAIVMVMVIKLTPFLTLIPAGRQAGDTSEAQKSFASQPADPILRNLVYCA